MCIAILNPPGITIENDILYNCWSNNDDGAGLLWVNKGKLESFKELKSFKVFAEQYQLVRESFPESNIVLHFRISTSGKCDLDNTHPFFVNDGLAFVHNGIIRELELGEPFSDTYYLNQMFQSFPPGWLDSDGIMKMLSSFIEGSKLIFLDKDNQYWIVNADQGEWHDGCWWSNYTYSYCYHSRGYCMDGGTGFSYPDGGTGSTECCSECEIELYGEMERSLGICWSCLDALRDIIHTRFVRKDSNPKTAIVKLKKGERKGNAKS